jgi:hypothetical protein
MDLITITYSVANADLQMSKLQSKHFVPAYYHAVPLGQDRFSPPEASLLNSFEVGPSSA